MDQGDVLSVQPYCTVTVADQFKSDQILDLIGHGTAAHASQERH